MATVESDEKSKVKIRSVQAIKYIEFDMPPGKGGVRVFKGPNGAGKTTAIQCLHSLLGRKVQLVPSDDAPDESGVIEGLGVKQKIGKRTTSKGELDAVVLDGFDIAELVEPSVKDVEARTKSRIKQLVGLTGQKCTAEAFRELFGSNEEFQSVVGGECNGITEPLELAAIVKKSAERGARDSEAEVEDATSRWQVAVERSKGVLASDKPKAVADLAGEYSVAKQELERAVALHQQSRSAEARNADIKKVRVAHVAAKPPLSLDKVTAAIETEQGKIERLREQLHEAEGIVAELSRDKEKILAWEKRRAEIESMFVPVPEEVVDIEPLKVAEQAALRALEDAEESRQRYESAVNAESLKAKIKVRKERAARLRKVAASVGSVITKLLPKSCALTVGESGQLGVQYDGRGKWVPMDELSEGERWEVCLSVAIDAVGAGGVIPVRQEAWQSLDNESRKAIAKQCSDAKVWLVTGEVGDGPLRVEEFIG